MIGALFKISVHFLRYRFTFSMLVHFLSRSIMGTFLISVALFEDQDQDLHFFTFFRHLKFFAGPFLKIEIHFY